MTGMKEIASVMKAVKLRNVGKFMLQKGVISFYTYNKEKQESEKIEVSLDVFVEYLKTIDDYCNIELVF